MEIKVEESSVRIDKYLTEYLEESRSSIAKMIEAGFILVNGKAIKANYVVKEGDLIIVQEGFFEEEDIKPENIPLDIVYEDDDLMVINKPSGMVVHPGNGNTHGTLVNALLYYTNNLSSTNGEVRPGIVHRIDKDTSGLMLVAKNNKAHEKLAEMLAKHEIKRTYIALLKGEFLSDTATIDAPIGRDRINRKKMAVTSENSKEAITHLRVLKCFQKYTLVSLELETGRTHQIRVHMEYIGYPIFNDPVYTNDVCTSFGQYLHSSKIDFLHPITGEKMHFEVDLPEEFKQTLENLELK